MKNLLAITSLLLCSYLQAQLGDDKEWKTVSIILGTRLEGTIMHDNSYFSVGAKYPFNENNYLSLRGHFNWWDTANRKFSIIPELDYIKKVKSFSDDASINTIYASGGITPNFVSPKVGVLMYHIFSVELGYNFEFRTNKHYETNGFRTSIGINIIY